MAGLIYFLFIAARNTLDAGVVPDYNNSTTTENPMPTRYAILGTTDERTSCDCCGKSNLKSTVALDDSDNGETVFFGVTCAARAMKIEVKAVKAGVNSLAAAKREQDRKAADEARRAETARWTAHLVARTGGIKDYRGDYCIFSMIQALGGFNAAAAGYRA